MGTCPLSSWGRSGKEEVYVDTGQTDGLMRRGVVYFTYILGVVVVCRFLQKYKEHQGPDGTASFL